MWEAPRPATLRRAVLDKSLVDLVPRPGRRQDRFVVKWLRPETPGGRRRVRAVKLP